MSDGEPERLQKVLARLGLASRREAEDWIRAGRLVVNGVIASLGTRVTPADNVRLDGRPLRFRQSSASEVFLVHRSPGEPLRESHATEPVAAGDDAEGAESSAGDEEFRTPILERLPRRSGRRYIAISPMPRVDGGLEVVTSDGELAERLQRAVRGLRTEFTVRVRGELAEPQVAGLMGGELDRGERLAVESVEPGGGEGANRWYTLVTRGASGKDVRQLFERQGALVSRILRTKLGSLSLDRSIARGQFRRLERGELDNLVASLAPVTEAEAAATTPADRRDRAPSRATEKTRGRDAGPSPSPSASRDRGGARPPAAEPARRGRGGAAKAPSRRARDRGRGSGPRPSGRR